MANKTSKYFIAPDFDRMSEEEADSFFAPRSMNSVKSIANVYIYLIITQNSDPVHHLQQKEILQMLEKFYEVKLERKACARIIHSLADAGLGIYATASRGVWFDKDAVYSGSSYVAA